MDEFQPQTIIEVMFGLQPDGTEKPAAMRRDQVPGHRIVWQAPVLRHFTARLQPIA